MLLVQLRIIAKYSTHAGLLYLPVTGESEHVSPILSTTGFTKQFYAIMYQSKPYWGGFCELLGFGQSGL
jgi:hypothetical protein